MELKKFTKSLIIYIVIFTVVLGVAMFYRTMSGTNTRRIAFSTMTSYLENNKIKEINITGTKITGKLSKDEYVYTYASNLVDIQYINDIIMELLQLILKVLQIIAKVQGSSSSSSSD